MLEVKDLHVNYGAVHALNGISLHVDDGEIVSLIGANGAGKTTTLRTITGLEKAASGSVMFDGHDLRKAEPSKIITYKLAHVPEGRHIFPQMTVEENLEMGAYADPAGMEETMKDVYKRFPRLEERRRQLAGTLSGGEQQMLAVGRALMAKPKMILMDEPSMGLSPLLVKEIFAIIQEVNKQGITILLVEQNAKMALAISDRAYVLETGNISIEGNAADRILQSPLPAPVVRAAAATLASSWQRHLTLTCMTASCCALPQRTAASARNCLPAPMRTPAKPCCTGFRNGCMTAASSRRKAATLSAMKTCSTTRPRCCGSC